MFFSYLTDKCGSEALVFCIRFSESYPHCDCLSNSRHRLLKPPRRFAYDPTVAERRTERWVGNYRSSIKKHSIYELIDDESETENGKEIRNRQIRKIKVGKEVLPQQETAEKETERKKKEKSRDRNTI